MKKNDNKQKGKRTALRQALEEDGRKLKWLSEVTEINYQRLQRIVNHRYEPTITEAAKISNAVKKPLHVLFPSPELHKALLLLSGEGFPESTSNEET